MTLYISHERTLEQDGEESDEHLKELHADEWQERLKGGGEIKEAEERLLPLLSYNAG